MEPFLFNYLTSKKLTMKRFTAILILTSLLCIPNHLLAFCGFYVSKADGKLFNKASQVIFVRDGQKSVITMSNDFYGDVKDFAMVVPVPTVLKEKDIKVVDASIFDKLDAYSGPRLVEYYDQNPCQQIYFDAMPLRKSMSMNKVEAEDVLLEVEEEDLGVTIEATYAIGEYDILILSAEESSGLKKWLTKNNYKIPTDAEEVLDPYIKNNLKFFVVKVNIEEQEELGYETLRPIQISFESNRFMLPIRLGMANAKDAQDLIVYAFTKNGRIESTNYRTAKIPSNKNIPTFVEDRFGQFYIDLFKKAYKRNGKNSVFLEYSWDISSSNYVKCDPCATTPPNYSELKDAGIFWVNENTYRGGSNYEGELFITRLHVKYDREHFPQDLFFQTTPNKENFQGRYIMQQAVKEYLDCPEAQKYYKEVINRHENELDELAYLTGWDVSEYNEYVNMYKNKLKRYKRKNDSDKGFIIPFSVSSPSNGFPLMIFFSAFLLVTFSSVAFIISKKINLS